MGSRKNPRMVSGSRWRRSRARVAIPNSSDPRRIPLRLMSSDLTFFHTHSSGLSSGERRQGNVKVCEFCVKLTELGHRAARLHE